MCLTYQRDGRATVRTVARTAERGVTTTFTALTALADAGFVALGVQGGLRPLVYIS